MNAEEKALKAIVNAALEVTRLRNEVDPGHVPMLKYLAGVVRKLSMLHDGLKARCEVESGG